VTSILGFLASNGDKIMLGGLVDAKTLGVYVIAAFMVGAIVQLFYRITSNVAFPAFSEVVRHNPAELCRRYYQFRIPLDIISLFLTGLLYSAGALLVHVLYNHRYDQAGYMLQILSISLFEVRYELVNSCMLALGKPRLLGPVIGIQAAVMFIFLPPIYRAFGIHAALWVITAAALCRMMATFWIKIANGLFDIRRELLFLPLLPAGYIVGIGLDALADATGFLP
jgi:O-antigen/teichoic acid export membrane protein